MPGTSKRKTPRRGRGQADSRGPLLYKVVELSTVDESTIERAVNQWVSQGFALEHVQFAMRDASKRPAMAFVFFTREGDSSADVGPGAEERERAKSRLSALAEPVTPRQPEWEEGE